MENYVTGPEATRGERAVPSALMLTTLNLVALLGTPRVTLFPEMLSAGADFRVAIEVQRFDSTPGDSAVLDAVWTVRRAKDSKSDTGRTSVRETVQEKSIDALVAAHSRAIARLSQDIAAAVRVLDGAPR